MSSIQATYINHMGSDLSVVNAARVSFGKQSGWSHKHGVGKPVGASYPLVLSDKDTKLIKYLARHKHLSPFGHAFASFHVKAPIFVARQLVKHKFLRVNEISRRYVDSDIEFYQPDVWRGRSEDKKQGSSGEVLVKSFDKYFADYEGGFCVDDSSDFNYVALDYYEHLLSEGVAPEMARMVLPQSLMTEWYWSGSLDAFAAMCTLRCASDTQYESRIVANQISDKMEELFPVSWKALMS